MERRPQLKIQSLARSNFLRPLKSNKSSTRSRLPKKPEATVENLFRIFTIPEDPNSTLGKIDKQISENLMGFLKEHIVTSDIQPSDLEKNFMTTDFPDDPIYVSDQAEFLRDKVVAQSVHTASPTFIGHMTSALPYFMLPLAKIMIALNQNLVKIETSKAFTPLERQVIGILHRLVYTKSESFYKKHVQDPSKALGSFCSDGTIANITALWVALNRLLPQTKDLPGLANDGMYAAMDARNLKRVAVLVSKRGHYSLKKAANILGIGRDNLISIPLDSHNKISIPKLKIKIAELKNEGVGIVAIVGIAGTTETGNVDPLEELADICEENKIHFHADAAWGGPTLCSPKYGYKLKGIERADSVTFDAHKQLYVPVGAGIALFKNPDHLQLVQHYAEYIIRKGSRDLGRMTLEGSRPGMAMLIHSGLRIIGQKGYAMLIEMGIEKAAAFADLIRKQKDFELISEPELNLLTYRYVPLDIAERLKNGSIAEKQKLNDHVNRLTISIQKEQREEGKSFVSRTMLEPELYNNFPINVFRVVLANPLTTMEILEQILQDQRRLAKKILMADNSLMNS